MAKESTVIVLEGVISSAKVGTTKFDDKIKNRVNLKCSSIPYDQIREYYENVGTRMTPKWLKEENGYMNLSSAFEVPVKDKTSGKEMTFKDFTNLPTSNGSECQISITLKEGACYPNAILITKEGEERDPFACFE